MESEVEYWRGWVDAVFQPADALPDSHKGKDHPDVPDLGPLSAQRNKQVADEPLVEPAVPAPPEVLVVVAIVNAPVHVFRHFDAVKQRPAPRHLPDCVEFHLNELERRKTCRHKKLNCQRCCGSRSRGHAAERGRETMRTMRQ